MKGKLYLALQVFKTGKQGDGYLAPFEINGVAAYGAVLAFESVEDLEKGCGKGVNFIVVEKS